MASTPTTGPPADEPGHRPTGRADIDVGHLSLPSEVADWIAAHMRRHAVKRWGYPEAISDLLAIAHHQEATRTETREERQAQIQAFTEAMAVRTPGQIHAEESFYARLHLDFGMGDVTGALKAAKRLGLQVRWYVDDQEVPAPQTWPHPRLDDPDSAKNPPAG